MTMIDAYSNTCQEADDQRAHGYLDCTETNGCASAEPMVIAGPHLSKLSLERCL